jgi:hypothetical protein
MAPDEEPNKDERGIYGAAPGRETETAADVNYCHIYTIHQPPCGGQPPATKLNRNEIPKLDGIRRDTCLQRMRESGRFVTGVQRGRIKEITQTNLEIN